VINDGGMADLVLHGISKYLAGAHGIRRYLGDSYWAPDYEARLSEMDRTRDFSDVAPSCTTFEKATMSPTRTSHCSGRRRISSWR